MEDCAANLRLPWLKPRGFCCHSNSHYPGVEPHWRPTEFRADELWRGGYPRFRAECSSFVRCSSCFRLTPISRRCPANGTKQEKKEGAPSDEQSSDGLTAPLQGYSFCAKEKRKFHLWVHAFHPLLGKAGAFKPVLPVTLYIQSSSNQRAECHRLTNYSFIK